MRKYLIWFAVINSGCMFVGGQSVPVDACIDELAINPIPRNVEITIKDDAIDYNQGGAGLITEYDRAKAIVNDNLCD